MKRNSGDARTTRARARVPARPPRRPGVRAILKVPIALKFTAFMTLMSLASMGWVSFRAVRIAEQTQENQINENGLLALGLISARLEHDWLINDDGQEELSRAVQRTFQQCREQGIKDILVYDTNSVALATGLGSHKIRVSRVEDRKTVHHDAATRSGVKIQDFIFQYSPDQIEPIRSFEKKILVPGSDGPRSIGRVQVLLSQRHIRESRDRIRNDMFILTVLTALAAAAGSFVLATFLTRPIRTLVKDLNEVSLGYLDHKSKVSTQNELGDLARTFNHMTDSLRQAQEIRIAQRATEHELNLATRIQQRLLPASTPRIGGFEVAAHYRSAKEVGGDYYDFLRIGQNHVGVVVADVSGKGIPGSLVMTMTRSLLRLATRGCTSPVDTVRAVNRTLSPDMNPGMFVTLLYFVLEVPTRSVQLVRAGHNGPLFYNAHQQRITHIDPKGIALGLDPTGSLFDSEIEVRSLTFEEGDVLVAFTDGVTEAKDAHGKDYSQESLARVVCQSAHRDASAIQAEVLASVDAHRAGAEQSDDITLVVFKFTGS